MKNKKRKKFMQYQKHIQFGINYLNFVIIYKITFKALF